MNGDLEATPIGMNKVMLHGRVENPEGTTEVERFLSRAEIERIEALRERHLAEMDALLLELATS